MTILAEGEQISISAKALAASGALASQVPAGYAIRSIYIQNLTANAVTGGLNIGVSSGGAEIVSAIAVGAHAFVAVPAASIGVNTFAAATTIYVSVVTSWNGASINLVLKLDRAVP